VNQISDLITGRVSMVAENAQTQQLAAASIKQRVDDWVKENGVAGRTLAYEKKGKNVDSKVKLIKSPDNEEWGRFTVSMSMREVEPGVKLQMNTTKLDIGPEWKAQIKKTKDTEADYE
jgi:hypothetical protein